MVSEFESWCTAKGRKQGNVGIVETQYGYHVMYFEGKTTVPWDDAVKSAIVTTPVQEYMSNLTKDDSVAITVVSDKALENVKDALLRMARNAIRNAAKQASSK